MNRAAVRRRHERDPGAKAREYAYRKKYRQDRPGLWNEYRRKCLYGMPMGTYQQMVAAQGGRCAICGEIPTKPLLVDHRHGDGQVRGLLCRTCNLGLGHFKDNPELLTAAIAYLARGLTSQNYKA